MNENKTSHTHKGEKHMIFFTGGIWVVCWPDALSAVAAVNAETDKAMTSSKKKAGREPPTQPQKLVTDVPLSSTPGL